MKKLILGLVLATVALAAAADYEWKVHKIIDGDTVAFVVPWLPPELGNFILVRVIGIDTPEKAWRARCPREATLGEAATLFTTKFIGESTSMTVVLHNWDKYGGRVDGSIFDAQGRDLATELMKIGLARPYDGGTKTSWCD